MSAVNQFEDDLLDLIFTNVDAPNIGDAAGLQNSAAAGSAQLRAVGTDLTDTDTTPATDEMAYTGYSAPTVARSVAEWTVSAGACTNDNEQLFGEKTGGADDTIEAIGICLLATGNYLQLYSNDPSLAVTNGINPRLAASALSITLT